MALKILKKVRNDIETHRLSNCLIKLIKMVPNRVFMASRQQQLKQFRRWKLRPVKDKGWESFREIFTGESDKIVSQARRKAISVMPRTETALDPMQGEEKTYLFSGFRV